MSSEVSTEIERLVGESRPSIQRIARRVCRIFLDEFGCTAYVKTIYVGFEHSGEMVAALYPLADSVEVALAIPEDYDNDLLEDATHLTWKTMPLAASLTKLSDVAVAWPMFKLASDRVASGKHDVDRPSEFFIGRSRRLSPDRTKNRRRPQE